MACFANNNMSSSNKNVLLFFNLVILSIIVLFLVNAEQWKEGDVKIVEIKQGLLAGKRFISRSGNNYHEFLGIPYGKVSVRFQPSVKADSWDGVKNAMEFGPVCIQYIFPEDKIIGDEYKCLVLNVYSPEVADGDLLPVMVFIHGGAYLFGSSGSYGPKYFMDEKIVLVTINYRLGAFGFLNVGEWAAGGNMGLKDQLLALEWIQENVKSFNGDKNQVTIFGESSGGVSVSLLALSPLTKGLIHGAISQSGTALTPLGFTENPIKQATKLAKALGCPTDSSRGILDCLTKVDAKLIIHASKQRDSLLWERSEVCEFLPSIETFAEDGASAQKFLSDHPYRILKGGNFNRVPYVLGVNSHEGLVGNAAPILYNEIFTKRFNEEWDVLAPLTFEYKDKVSSEELNTISSKIKSFYFGNEKMSLENLNKLTELFTDRWLLHSTKLFAELYSQFSPTYIYNFTKTGTASFLDVLKIPSKDPYNKPPTHVDELQYQFDGIYGLYLFPFIDTESPHYNFSRNFVRLWTSFATYRKPTGVWGSEREWKPIVASSDTVTEWLQIDNTKTKMVEEDPSVTQRYEFWQNLPLRENERIGSAIKQHNEL